MLTYHGSLVQAYMCSIVPATVATAGTGAPSGALHLPTAPGRKHWQGKRWAAGRQGLARTGALSWEATARLNGT